MSIEKQDNWRRKLLDIDNLPGDTVYNKEAAWHQLQSRLQPAPRRKKTYWYWAAAALLVFLGWPLLIKKTATQLPEKNIAGRQFNKAVTPGLPVKKESPAFIVVSNQVATKTTTQKPSRQTIQTINTIEDTALPVFVRSDQPSSAAATGLQADSAALTAAIAKPEKKMPVVHINDLETAGSQLALSTAPVRGQWRTKRSHRSTGNQLVAAQKGYDGIINIKLSSKN